MNSPHLIPVPQPNAKRSKSIKQSAESLSLLQTRKRMHSVGFPPKTKPSSPKKYPRVQFYFLNNQGRQYFDDVAHLEPALTALKKFRVRQQSRKSGPFNKVSPQVMAGKTFKDIGKSSLSSDSHVSHPSFDIESSSLREMLDQEGDPRENKTLVRKLKKKKLDYYTLKVQKSVFKRELLCSICLQLYIKPVSLPCGHSFCRYCLLTYFEKNQLNCGVCRSSDIQTHPLDLKINVTLDSLSRQINPKSYYRNFKHQMAEQDQSSLIQKLNEKYPYSEDFTFDLVQQQKLIREEEQMRNMTTFQKIKRRILLLIQIVLPYVRFTRIVVTYFAPILLMILYLLHQYFRTKRVWSFIRNFKSDRAFLGAPTLLSQQARQPGIMELTQLNDMFWVRLTQVIATVIGY